MHPLRLQGVQSLPPPGKRGLPKHGMPQYEEDVSICTDRPVLNNTNNLNNNLINVKFDYDLAHRGW